MNPHFRKTLHFFAKSCLAFSFFLLFTFIAQGQNETTISWLERGSNKDVTFYQVQKNFNEFWKGKKIPRSQGYKVFKRWEEYMEPRVYPSGNMAIPSMAYENYMEWLNNSSESRSSSSMTTTGNWTSLNPSAKPTGYDSGVGRIDFVRFDPTNSNTMYVGAPDGGLWKSIDAGANWTTNTDFLGVIGCSDLAINPNNTDSMYLATGNWETDRRSIGILRSIDGGTTWSPTSLTWSALDNYKIRRMVMHPNDPLIMMIVTDGGVFRTDDGWVTNDNVYCCNTLFDIKFKPGDPTVVYASGEEFWKSTDTGVNWTQVTSGLPPSTSVQRSVMGVSPADPTYVYIIAGNNDGGYLGTYRSTDSGATFSLQSSTPNILNSSKDATGTGGQASHDLAIVVSPTDADLVTIGGISQWRSTDGGVNWTLLSYWLGDDVNYPGQGDGPPDYIHADIQFIDYLPGSSTVMFATCDGGISKSINNGANWTDISNNLSVAQSNIVAMSASSPDILIAGLQDIGSIKREAAGWKVISGGDGEGSFIDRTNHDRIITSTAEGQYFITLDGGINYADVLGLPSGEFFSPIHQDPVDANTAYVGGRPALYKNVDVWSNPNTWTTLGTPPGPGNILRFMVAPSDPTVIYAIKDGVISKSTDTGMTWADVTGTLPMGSAFLKNLTISNTDADKVWVVFSGYEAADKVYKTTDGGTTWTNMSTGLPNLPMNDIVHVNSSANESLYLGADIGVFYFDNTLSAWALFNSDLPNVAVSDLEIFYPTLKLRAATYGRGTWESDLNMAGGCVPNLVITQSPIPGGTYRSQGELTSNNSTVATSTTVTFISDTGVTLTGDFEVLMGGIFEILIQACP